MELCLLFPATIKRDYEHIRSALKPCKITEAGGGPENEDAFIRMARRCAW